MRILLALSAALTACGLAIEPVGVIAKEHAPPSALQLDGVSADSQIAPSDFVRVAYPLGEGPAAVLEPRVVKDVLVPSGIKRPQPITLNGVTFHFRMVQGWVKKDVKNVYYRDYTCDTIIIVNLRRRYRDVSVIAGGVRLLKKYRMSSDRVTSVRAPEGGFPKTLDIDVAVVKKTVDETP